MGFKSARNSWKRDSRLSSSRGNSKNSRSSHASFRRINRQLNDLNKSIDKSLTSRGSQRNYQYNERKIAVRSRSISMALKPGSKRGTIKITIS